eukprot:s87_g34.t1
MAPKKKEGEKRGNSEYSYFTDEEGPEREPSPPDRPAPKAAAVATATAAPKPSLTEREANERGESSSDRGPRARSHRSPFSPARDRRARSRSPEKKARKTRRARGKAEEEGDEPRDPPRRERPRSPQKEPRGRSVPFPMVPPPPPEVPPSPRGKGKSKGRKQYCPHCWQKVGTDAGGGNSGMSQHMFWNELCLAWQYYGDGHRMAWDQAAALAHDLKKEREQEAQAEMGPEHVKPARSLAHRRTMEVEGDAEEKADDAPREREHRHEKKRKKKHRRHRPSPSPDVRSGPKHPRKPPSSDDEEDRDAGASKRRKAPDEVWIKVPRSLVMGR